MSFHTTWNPDAFDRMGRIIRAHPEYKDMFAALLREMSEACRDHPAETGESRVENDRIAFFGPLGVSFRVLAADQEVRILDVHLTTLLL